MRFLIKSSDEFGPNFSALFEVIPGVYGSNVRFDLLKGEDELAQRIETGAWEKYLDEGEQLSVRRALVLAVDWQWDAPDAGTLWKDFALEALNTGVIAGSPLPSAVDVIILARESTEPEIFSARQPECSMLVDYTHIHPGKGAGEAIKILTQALDSPGSSLADNPAQESRHNKRQLSDEDFQP
jgi:hypothetical protein